ncbi:hypothetical protein HJ526_05220 [Donghicola sp. C2-DW-16]|uniref:DUF4276 family protein n=1 Tax=Donghicola mangrovi TaxID=2729614 RepID=A0ABX2PDT5_9RHOB|nr:hypothetical protein [Donghicola mangrovi]NVO26809.1 hypothetical protein [Donghicola mangrovi]
MRFGLVCEGATDFITVANFLTKALSDSGVSADFIDLQPGLDKTSEVNCGWSNALLWLKKNNLKQRQVAILGRGLFSGNLAHKKCDAIIILLDSDCAVDDGFLNFCRKHVEQIPGGLTHVDTVKQAIVNFSELSLEDAKAEKHVICAASHNSESWCVGLLPDDSERAVEQISIEETNTLLLAALAEMPDAALVDVGRRVKDRALRREFCRQNLAKIDSLISRSSSFNQLLNDTREVSEA